MTEAERGSMTSACTRLVILLANPAGMCGNTLCLMMKYRAVKAAQDNPTVAQSSRQDLGERKESEHGGLRGACRCMPPQLCTCEPFGVEMA